MTWALIAAAVAGGIYLLHATGLLYLVKPAVGWLRALIPSPDPRKDRAKLDARAIADGSASQGQREAIAAQRASDETYNQAFKRERRKQRNSQPQAKGT
jgi:hypothetical protein